MPEPLLSDPEFLALYGELFVGVKDPRNLSLTDLCRVLFERGVRLVPSEARHG